jgi:hypothetical protein
MLGWAEAGVERSESGVSLVETMMALTLISIHLLGALSMLMVAQDGISEGAKRLEAMALVETNIERIRVVDYRALLTFATEDETGEGFPEMIQEHGTETVQVGTTTTRRTVHGIILTTRVSPDHFPLAESGTCTITVVAAWRDNRGRPKTVRLKMSRANPVYAGVRSPGAAS